MREDFTPYRGQARTPHVVGFRCAHRGTQMAIGWVEDDCIRCTPEGENVEVLQVDRMDGGQLMGPDLALAKAETALNFQRPSGELGHAAAAIERLSQVAHFKLLPMGGGVPLPQGGAIGISGGGQQVNHEIARLVAGLEKLSS
jgi:uncharacterized protein GlcG (DUF336 family)